ncbi:MAG TPA: hypothetical protein VN719_09530 [Gemmatimonadales bacterium]|nr:hypothetical protein [Gemmatimonadales bacterium]
MPFSHAQFLAQIGLTPLEPCGARVDWLGTEIAAVGPHVLCRQWYGCPRCGVAYRMDKLQMLERVLYQPLKESL